MQRRIWLSAKISKMKLFCEYKRRFIAATYFFKQFHIRCLPSKYASELCFSRVSFYKIDQSDQWRNVTIHSVVCRVNVFCRLDFIKFNISNYCPSKQIRIRIHQQQNMVSNICTNNKNFTKMVLFLSLQDFFVIFEHVSIASYPALLILNAYLCAGVEEPLRSIGIYADHL